MRLESLSRMPKHLRLRMVEEAEPYPEDVERPQVRGDCLAGGINEARPCPFVSCKHHLGLDVNPYGRPKDMKAASNIRFTFPDHEIWDLAHSCVLDVADLGGLPLEEVAIVSNVSRENIRLIEAKSLARLRSIVLPPEMAEEEDGRTPVAPKGVRRETVGVSDTKKRRRKHGRREGKREDGTGT